MGFGLRFLKIVYFFSGLRSELLRCFEIFLGFGLRFFEMFLGFGLRLFEIFCQTLILTIICILRFLRFFAGLDYKIVFEKTGLEIFYLRLFLGNGACTFVIQSLSGLSFFDIF